MLLDKLRHPKFWSKTRLNEITGCIEWIATTVGNGYGSYYHDNYRFYAHRYAYANYVKSIPDHLQVLHHCDNPCCVNPEHLFLGSIKENMADKILKGRSRGCDGLGDNNFSSKLTILDVKTILILGELFTTIKLGRMFKVNRSNISQIKTRRTWKHILVSREEAILIKLAYAT